MYSGFHTHIVCSAHPAFEAYANPLSAIVISKNDKNIQGIDVRSPLITLDSKIIKEVVKASLELKILE